MVSEQHTPAPQKSSGLPLPEVSVIIPTLADRGRASMLQRCITSIRNSSRSSIPIIVVANGMRSDEKVFNWLKMQPDVTLVVEPQPSAPNAVRRGREFVTTPFFSTLDDDDEYLPKSTDLKLAALKASPGADLIVTNGYRRINAIDEIVYQSLPAVPDAPLTALFSLNWLASCNALFRSDSIGIDLLSDFHPYVEWTWLAYKLSVQGKKVAIIDHQPTLRP